MSKRKQIHFYTLNICAKYIFAEYVQLNLKDDYIYYYLEIYF